MNEKDIQGIPLVIVIGHAPRDPIEKGDLRRLWADGLLRHGGLLGRKDCYVCARHAAESFDPAGLYSQLEGVGARRSELGLPGRPEAETMDKEMFFLMSDPLAAPAHTRTMDSEWDDAVARYDSAFRARLSLREAKPRQQDPVIESNEDEESDTSVEDQLEKIRAALNESHELGQQTKQRIKALAQRS